MQEDSSNWNEQGKTVLLDPRLEPFGMCMICNGEYSPNTVECPSCQVALSLVRRCHNCSRVVSAKHRRCIHCGQAFFPDDQGSAPTPEDSLDRIAAARKLREAAKRRNRLRGLSVSVATFLTVLFLAMLVMHKFSSDDQPSVIAQSYLLRSAELRRAASDSSANMAMLEAGKVVDITSSLTGQHGQRWIALKWNDQTAYVEADAVAPPKAREAVRGAELLKFYIAGIKDPALITEAAKAVDYYNQSFPQSTTAGQELRWELAGQARLLAEFGPSREQLLADARAQYQMLIDTNGELAAKARAEINAPLRSKGAGQRAKGSKQKTELTITGSGRPDPQTITGFDKNPAHEVMLLERASIRVRWTRPEKSTAGENIGCSVIGSIRSNEQLLIPAGSPCQLNILSLKDKIATLTLAAVVVRNRSYQLNTSAVTISDNPGTAPQESSFRLRAPVAFTN